MDKVLKTLVIGRSVLIVWGSDLVRSEFGTSCVVGLGPSCVVGPEQMGRKVELGCGSDLVGLSVGSVT